MPANREQETEVPSPPHVQSTIISFNNLRAKFIGRAKELK